jgi:hypothetical protein
MEVRFKSLCRQASLPSRQNNKILPVEFCHVIKRLPSLFLAAQQLNSIAFKHFLIFWVATKKSVKRFIGGYNLA